MEDIREDPIILYGDVLVFCETWLDPTSDLLTALCYNNNIDSNSFCCQHINEDQFLQIHGYKLHFNSSSRRKGIAVY